MKTVWAVFWYECVMELRRPFVWVAFFLVVCLGLAETFPHAANFQRLTHLDESSYAAMRLVHLGLPVLALAVAILTAGRLPVDQKLGMEALLWTSARYSALGYTIGKFLGNLGVYSLLSTLFVLTGLLARALFYPQGCEANPFLLSLGVMVLPALVLVIGVALLAGAVAGIKGTGVLFTLYIFWSSGFASADEHGVTQIYRFMGNLPALLFVPPKWPYAAEMVAAAWHNLWFSIVVGLVGVGLAALWTGIRRWKGGRG